MWGLDISTIITHVKLLSLQSHSFIGLCQKIGKADVDIQTVRFWGKVEVRSMVDGSDDICIIRFACGIYIFLVEYSASLSAWSGSSSSLEASSA